MGFWTDYPTENAVGLIGAIIASAFIPKKTNPYAVQSTLSPEQDSNRTELMEKLDHLGILGQKASEYADVEEFFKAQGHSDEIDDQREETLDEFKDAAKDIAKFLINECGFHMKAILGSKSIAGVSNLVDGIYEMHNHSKVHAKTLMHHLEKASTEENASSWYVILDYIQSDRLAALSEKESELLTSGMLAHIFKTDDVLETATYDPSKGLKNIHLAGHEFLVQTPVAHFQADKICSFLHPEDKDRLAEQLKKISSAIIKTCKETKKSDTDIIIFADSDHDGLKAVMNLNKWYQECSSEAELPCVTYLKTLMSSQYHYLNDYFRTSGVRITGPKIPSEYTKLIASVVTNLSHLS